MRASNCNFVLYSVLWQTFYCKIIVLLYLERMCFYIPALVQFNIVKKIQKKNNVLGTFVEDSKIGELNCVILFFLELQFEYDLRVCDVLEPPESSIGPDILKG